MSAWLDTLHNCCEAVLHGDQQVIARLRESGFDCDEGHWSFRLPALHVWLFGERVALEYPAFLKQLYTSDLNGRLARYGAQIVIADNRGKVSESLYRLQRLS
ncbi:hypothetical protein BVH03_19485 [Pseudomonas sp. PA15(2017)]|uniref:hypothetical protein n=1 Tax=Pseudomonas sp. PA15(2017) TaxID=1932111 RepID=UPI0009668066|nr:hypothetical protein [Pseudomonas sp. PA15(2017)]OLU24766.1 hypothetical protein BVH03_19485 [Pseudomonas sp. PA15(2017)]